MARIPLEELERDCGALAGAIPEAIRMALRELGINSGEALAVVTRIALEELEKNARQGIDFGECEMQRRNATRASIT